MVHVNRRGGGEDDADPEFTKPAMVARPAISSMDSVTDSRQVVVGDLPSTAGQFGGHARSVGSGRVTRYGMDALAGQSMTGCGLARERMYSGTPRIGQVERIASADMA